VSARSPEAVDLRVAADHPGTLVVRQSFAEGWQAQLDGHDTPVRPADVLFQAVQVPAGQHLVTLRYRPSSVTWGLIASLMGLAGVALLAVGPWAVGRARRRIGWGAAPTPLR